MNEIEYIDKKNRKVHLKNLDDYEYKKIYEFAKILKYKILKFSK
jgi:hypothetical protein